jgi:hypothetical protein
MEVVSVHDNLVLPDLDINGLVPSDIEYYRAGFQISESKHFQKLPAKHET